MKGPPQTRGKPGLWGLYRTAIDKHRSISKKMSRNIPKPILGMALHLNVKYKCINCGLIGKSQAEMTN